MSVLVFKYKNKEYRLVDKIESIIGFTDMFKKYYKNIPEYLQEKEIVFDSDSHKEDIIKNLKKATSFRVEDDIIIVTYKPSNKEIKEIKQGYLNDYNRFLNILYSYYKKDEYKELIKAYLITYNLKYLIKELNKLDNIN